MLLMIWQISFPRIPPLTWSDLSTNKFGARFCPKGFIFDASGPTMFLAKEDINFILGYINTIVYQQILNIICPGLHYNNGAIAKTPIVFPQEGEKEKVKILAAESVNISKEDWDSSEVSWDFAKHPLLVHKKNGKVAEAYKVWHVPNSRCVKFDDIKMMKRFDLRQIFNGMEVVYIYHNQIDARGDKQNTENEVFSACTEAIEEIYSLIKRLSVDVNTYHFVVTADHGEIAKRH